jgi:putative oxidoreductase
MEPKPDRQALGIALLRASLGVMFLAHSVVLKHFQYTLPGTAAYFGSLGLPPALAYVVFVAEVAGGLLLLAGIGTRVVSLALTPILLGALWVHGGNGWVFTSVNGGWEYPFYLLVLCVAQSLLGSGAYAVRFTNLRPRARRVIPGSTAARAIPR